MKPWYEELFENYGSKYDHEVLKSVGFKAVTSK